MLTIASFLAQVRRISIWVRFKVWLVSGYAPVLVEAADIIERQLPPSAFYARIAEFKRRCRGPQARRNAV